MTSRRLPAREDPTGPEPGRAITVELDGRPLPGLAGQTIAGVLLGAGVLSWRRSPRTGRPRGVFCGIGSCWDCLLEVNGLPDVRACQRRAVDGDVCRTQGPGPADRADLADRADRAGRPEGDVGA